MTKPEANGEFTQASAMHADRFSGQATKRKAKGAVNRSGGLQADAKQMDTAKEK